MVDKKAQSFGLNQLASVAVIIVVVGMVSVLGLQLLGDTKDDIGLADCATRSDDFITYSATNDACTNGTHYRAVNTSQFDAVGDGITGVAKIPDKLPLIVGAVVLVIVISIIIVAFKSISN